jgi:hypothetical protein
MLHWIIDTACDEHMVSSADYFSPGTTKTTLRTVRMALAIQSANCIIGDIDMVLGSTRGKAGTPVRLHDVLCVPGIQRNLVSGTNLADRGADAVFKRRGLELTHENGTLLATGTIKGHNWLLNVQEIIQSPVTVLETSATAEDTVIDTEAVRHTDDNLEVVPRIDKRRRAPQCAHFKAGPLKKSN